jgi:hypothetical protein
MIKKTFTYAAIILTLPIVVCLAGAVGCIAGAIQIGKTWPGDLFNLIYNNNV